MQPEKSLLYGEAIASVKASEIKKKEEKTVPKDSIVATHGPALTKAIKENPALLNLIGIYRINCSHIGKESSLEDLAEYIRTINPFVPILIDLQ